MNSPKEIAKITGLTLLGLVLIAAPIAIPHALDEHRAKNTKWVRQVESSYTIYGWSLGKHVYVRLEEDGTGQLYSLYVCKHLSEIREKLWVGKKIFLVRNDYVVFGNPSPEFSDVRRALENSPSPSETH